MDSRTPSNPPTIDFSSENLKPGTSIWLSTSKQVKDALENHGFFMAKYDKISSEVKNAFYQAIKEFHDLPTEKKSQVPSDQPYLGYFRWAVDEVTMLELTTIKDPTSVEAVEGFINVFCSDRKKDYVSEVMQSYSKHLAELHEVILRMVCESYGIEEYYESLRESLAYLCRVNKYRAAKLNEDVGLKPHTDISLTTIIHQNQVNGLEVKSNDGTWVAVDFPPSSFAVLAGDALMAWSNGRIASKFHRVIMAAEEPRYSINFFCYKNGIVEAPKELVDEQHPLLYKPFDHFELASLIFKKRSATVEDKLKVFCGV